MDSSLHGLEVSSKSVDCCGVVTLIGEVDLDTVPLIESHIEALTGNSTKHLLFDCEALGFIDSSGIHALESARQAVNGSLGLVRLRKPLQRLFEIVGLSHEFAVFNSVEEAQEHLHNGAQRPFAAGA